MLWLFLKILLSVASAVLIYVELKRKRLSNRFQHIPGPPEYPIIGNILTLRSNKLTDYQNTFDQICVEPISKIVFGGQLILMVSEPVALQQILSSQAFLSKPFLSDFLGMKYGLSSAKYHIWKPIRKGINVAFSHRASLALIPLFNKYSDNYRHELNSLLDADSFDMYDISVKITTKQLLASTVREPSVNFDRRIIEKWAEAITKRAVNPIFYPYWIFQHSKMYKPYRAGHDHLRQIWSEVVLATNNNSEDLYGRVLIDELLRMAQEDDQINYRLIYDNLTSVLSGFETLSLTISYAILMLAMHPEVDKKLEDEIFNHFNPSRPVDYDLIKQLTYLDMVVKETLRLFPVSPISPRESIADSYVENIGKVPKGTIIVIPFHKLHRWKYIWGPDAETFNPDHFLPENIRSRHIFSYLPFSSGSRNCVGYNYAVISVKIALVKIISEFKFTTHLKMSELILKLVGTLKLQNGHLVQVQRRMRK